MRRFSQPDVGGENRGQHPVRPQLTPHTDIVPARWLTTQQLTSQQLTSQLLTIELMDRPSVRPVVLVPVKSFTEAKVRLAPVLSAPQRTRLSERMARAVLTSAGELPTFVVCDHASVAEWARSNGFAPLLTRASGLNPSLTEAVARIEAGTGEVSPAHGCTHALIVHGDLPQARTLDGLCHSVAVTMVTDRRRDGTNVLCVPLGTGFAFHYGAGSYAAHVAEAHKRRLGVLTRRVPELELDVDHPDDLAAAQHLLGEAGPQ